VGETTYVGPDPLGALIAAGDDLRDDLSVLLDTWDVEGKASALGLEVTAHIDEWARQVELWTPDDAEAVSASKGREGDEQP
jgi:hypothetical protein